ncbi:MAG: hypothetical protein QG608_1314 [Actinomycetota bacterium]|nr:hypothetical protein [Actinomycetota bacterium]
MSGKKTRLVVGALALTLTIGGVGVATSSSATSGLSVDPGTTKITTLNFGKKISNGAVTARLANATPGLRVTSKNLTKLRLVLDDYVAPQDVDPHVLPSLARLYYRQAPAGSDAVPTTKWKYLTQSTTSSTASGPSTSDDPGKLPIRKQDRAVHLTSDVPGTFTFHFVDPGLQSGTDDDARSASYTLEVLDVYRATSSALSDDWRPSVTLSPDPVGVARSLTATVDLARLTRVDARGTSGGIGQLNSRLASLVGLRFESTSTDALSYDLKFPGVLPFTQSWSTPAAVSTSGTVVVPATYEGLPVLRHIGTVKATATLDRNGNSIFSPGPWPGVGEDLPFTDTGQVVARVPGVVTVGATPLSIVTGSKVTVSGTAADSSGTIVTILGTVGSSQRTLATTVINSTTGAFSVPVTLIRTTTIVARTDDGVSAPVTVKVSAVVKSFKVSTPGKRKVVLRASGTPSGTFTFYRNGAWLGTVKGTSGTLTRTVSKGKATFSVKLVSPNTLTSKARSVTVRVR